MRILLLILIITGYTNSYSQEIDYIREINTNKSNMMGMIANVKYNFKMYDDSLVMLMTGGTGYKSMIKKNIPLKAVYNLKCNVSTIGNMSTYTYQDEKIRIQIAIDDKMNVALLRSKDSFTGRITDITYY